LPPRLRAWADGKKCWVQSFGCWMNDRDSETLAGLMEAAGFRQAGSAEDADVLILNTCCVCAGAEAQAGEMLHAADPSQLVCVLGCMTQQQGSAEELLEKYPFIRVLSGAGRPQELYGLLERAVSGETVVSVSSPGIPPEGLPVKRTSSVSAYVAISTGCDNHCSYCAVPLVRGAAHSRRSEEIIKEVLALKKGGWREVTLVGHNVNAFGFKEGFSFPRLLLKVADTGIERIRFYTSHPKDVSPALLKTMAALPTVEQHLHLPLQSGSDRILRAMKRGYTRDDYLRIAKEFYRLMPLGSLTTDVITGFPGEKEADFEETLAVFREVGFDFVYAFTYSPRKGTAAAKIADQVPESVKWERYRRLEALAGEIASKRRTRFEGSVEQVLVAGISSLKGMLFGRNSAGLTVRFPGDSSLVGSFVFAEIISSDDSGLIGRLL